MQLCFMLFSPAVLFVPGPAPACSVIMVGSRILSCLVLSSGSSPLLLCGFYPTYPVGPAVFHLPLALCLPWFPVPLVFFPICPTCLEDMLWGGGVPMSDTCCPSLVLVFKYLFVLSVPVQSLTSTFDLIEPLLFFFDLPLSALSHIS